MKTVREYYRVEFPYIASKIVDTLQEAREEVKILADGNSRMTEENHAFWRREAESAKIFHIIAIEEEVN